MIPIINRLAILTTCILSFISGKIKKAPELRVQEGIVYALPIKKPKIDGKLDDWPQSLQWNPISKAIKNPMSDDTKRNARFKVAYDLSNNKLLVAVEYFDTYRLVSDSLSKTSQDTHILYVDQDRDLGGSGVMYHYANEKIAENGDMDNPRYSRVGALASEKIISATRINGSRVTIEYEVELASPVRTGNAIGLGHLIVDFNADNTNEYITWTKGGAKHYTSQKMGTVVFADTEYLEKMGKLKGTIKKPTNASFEIPKYLRVKSMDNAGLWFDMPIDSLGNYGAQLPLGTYDLTPYSTFTSIGEQKTATDIRWVKWDKTLSHSEVWVRQNQETVHQGPELYVKPFGDPNYPLSLLLDDKRYNEASIQDKLTRYMEYFEIPGVSVAIIEKGEVKNTFTLGKANVYRRTVLDDKSLFEAASISKPVFAFAVMRLVEKGIIDLDEPLYKTYVHPDIAKDPQMKLITPRYVLNHTTGFPNWPGDNPENKLSIKFTPGTDHGYSGAGFEYLKEVIVLKTGRDISSILKEEVLDVFNMKNTYFEENDYLNEHKVHGHLDGNPTRRDFVENANVASSMHINAAELSKFFIGIRNRIGLRPETYKEFLEFDTRTYSEWEDKIGWKSWFGLGIFLEETPLGKTFGHSGNNGDFTCIATYFEKEDVGFVLMTNSNKGDILFEPLERMLISGNILGR